MPGDLDLDDLSLRHARRPRWRRAGRADRRGRPADLPDLDLRAGRASASHADGYEYARSQNPTRERLERAVAALEGGRHGFAFASGSAATAAIAELAVPGEEIVVGDDVYGGTYPLPRAGPQAGRRRRRRASRPDGRDGRAVGGAVRADPARLVRVTDQPAAQDRRHRRGRRGPSTAALPRVAGDR